MQKTKYEIKHQFVAFKNLTQSVFKYMYTYFVQITSYTQESEKFL